MLPGGHNRERPSSPPGRRPVSHKTRAQTGPQTPEPDGSRGAKPKQQQARQRRSRSSVSGGTRKTCDSAALGKPLSLCAADRASGEGGQVARARAAPPQIRFCTGLPRSRELSDWRVAPAEPLPSPPPSPPPAEQPHLRAGWGKRRSGAAVKLGQRGQKLGATARQWRGREGPSRPQRVRAQGTPGPGLGDTEEGGRRLPAPVPFPPAAHGEPQRGTDPARHVLRGEPWPAWLWLGAGGPRPGRDPCFRGSGCGRGTARFRGG